ncbi:hypothetical protein BpHYR1_047518 [Brachionus plicatilis]|uniref:Uncharacterized protein n=1 Tax=Brachionus plicatilis TaxID=10195 RepID=A0A3M7SQ21_BRAPC|nr:hypothetical protein BpHYR1_047518 [Brachionus plicatilis]
MCMLSAGETSIGFISIINSKKPLKLVKNIQQTFIKQEWLHNFLQILNINQYCEIFEIQNLTSFRFILRSFERYLGKLNSDFNFVLQR